MKPLLKEWSEGADSKRIQSAIRKYMYNIDYSLGLAYTSSSDCAGLWVCNLAVYNRDHVKRLVGFVMDEDKTIFALWYGDNEEEYYEQIS